MQIRPARRFTTLSMSFAVVSLVAAFAAPAAMGYTETSRSGPNPRFDLDDSAAKPGATCRYENHSGQKRDELDKLSVRRMTAGGPFSATSWVGQRVIVQRNAKPFNDGKWKTVWSSKVIKRLAPGDSGGDKAVFPARHWKTPETSGLAIASSS